VSDPEQLRSLAVAYASGVDQRNADRILSAFHPDAVFTIYGPASATEPTGVMNGHSDLARIAVRIAVYVKTFHLLGQSRYDVTRDEATGETYCEAHHIDLRGDRPIDRVMYIRYQDTYRRDDGAWRIATRTLLTDWVDIRNADLDPPLAPA
jgi:SnoaL-like domain